jgi:lysophospholipase L1-like esterase
VLGLLAGGLLTEAFLRVFDIGPELNVVYKENYRLSDNPVLVWELVPGGQDGLLRISSAGLRDREFSLTKPDGVFRIVAIGDSVTVSRHIMRSQTWPKQLEALLNEYAPPDAPTFEVLNLGVIGYNAHQAVEALRAKGLPFDPDLAIWGYVMNDTMTDHLIERALREMQGRAEQQLGDALSRGLGRAFAHWRIYALLNPTTIDLPEDSDVTWMGPILAANEQGQEVELVRSLHTDPEGWQRLTAAVTDLAETSGPAGRLPAAVAVFPIARREGFRAYPLQDVHDKVMREAQRHGLDSFDLTLSFARVEERYPDRSLYTDLIHPNEFGNQVVAVAMLEALCRAGRLPAGCEIWDATTRGKGSNAELARLLGAARTGERQ